MADFGIKVSKTGFDIGTAVTKDLAFSSQFNSLKISTSGSVNVTGTGEITANHALGYIPAFVSWVKVNGGDMNGYVYTIPNGYPSSPFIHFASIGTGNIKWVVELAPANMGTTSFASSYDIKYVIFVNQIN